MNEVIKKSKILLLSSGIVHPDLRARWRLRRIISHNISVQAIHRVDRLRKLQHNDYVTVVLYLHRQNITDQALDALAEYVRRGGGLLAVHSASASFKDENRFFEIIGGRFQHHGPIRPFWVEQVTGKENIFSVTEPFSAIDELYHHRLLEDINIHFIAVEAGRRQPVVWTRRYGRGRVCYCMFGHRPAVFRILEVQKIIREGLRWLIGNKPETA